MNRYARPTKEFQLDIVVFSAEVPGDARQASQPCKGGAGAHRLRAPPPHGRRPAGGEAEGGLQAAGPNKTLFQFLLQSHKEVIKDIMVLSPEKAASLQHSLKMTVSTRRKLTSSCINLWGFTFLPGEKEQKVFEDKVCSN